MSFTVPATGFVFCCYYATKAYVVSLTSAVAEELREMSFRLVSKHDAPRTHFAPISPEEPFAYLQRLKDAYLAEKDGQIGAQWEESR